MLVRDRVKLGPQAQGLCSQPTISYVNVSCIYPTPVPDDSCESQGKMPPDPGVAHTSGLEKVKESLSFPSLGEVYWFWCRQIILSCLRVSRAQLFLYKDSVLNAVSQWAYLLLVG